MYYVQIYAKQLNAIKTRILEIEEAYKPNLKSLKCLMKTSNSDEVRLVVNYVMRQSSREIARETNEAARCNNIMFQQLFLQNLESKRIRKLWPVYGLGKSIT